MHAERPGSPLATRLAQGLACGGLAQLVQMPFLRDLDVPVSPAFFVAHGLVVIAIQGALALGLGRSLRIWTAGAFLAAPVLAVWPAVHADFGASGLALLGLGAVVAIGVLGGLAPRSSPLLAAAAGGLFGAELALGCRPGAESGDALRPLVVGGAGLALLVAGRWWPALAPRPSATASLGLGVAALALAAVFAPLGHESFASGPAGPADPDAPPSVALIVLDALRPDHLALYGYERETMPALERFAREHAVVVERAISVGSSSLPTHASMFTGLDPPRHGARYPDSRDPNPPDFAHPLGPGPPTLAETLGEVGYWSVGVSGNAGPLAPEFGLGRGFDVYRAIFDATAERRHRSAWHLAAPGAEPLLALAALPLFRDVELFAWGQRYRRAAAIADEAIAAVDAAGEHPFFLFVNFIDAHWPYDPPARCRGREAGHPADGSLLEHINLRGRVLLAEERERLVALYDGELRCLDESLGQLLARLEQHPRWAEMLVVITSDHGEALGEHGTIGHGLTLYQEQIRVPLLIKPGRGPRLPRPGTRIPGPIQPTDLFASVLEHAGLPLPPDGDGRPWGRGRQVARAWLGVKQGAAAARPDRYRRDLRAVQGDGWKLIASSRGPLELYDLARDPGETTDLGASEAKRLSRLERQLGAVPVPARGPRAPSREATLDRLRALGDVE